MPTPIVALEALARSIIDFCLSFNFLSARARWKTFNVVPSCLTITPCRAAAFLTAPILSFGTNHTLVLVKGRTWRVAFPARFLIAAYSLRRRGRLKTAVLWDLNMMSGTCSRSVCATAGPGVSQSTQPISGIAQIRRLHIMIASFRDADWRRNSLTVQRKYSPNRLLRGIGRCGLDVRRASHFGLDGRARIAGQLVHVGQTLSHRALRGRFGGWYLLPQPLRCTVGRMINEDRTERPCPR